MALKVGFQITKLNFLHAGKGGLVKNIFGLQK
jgi:hypothetical protein